MRNRAIVSDLQKPYFVSIIFRMIARTPKDSPIDNYSCQCYTDNG